MKKSLVLIISIITFLSFSCVNVNSKKMTIDTKKDKNLYERKISVFPMENVEISNDVIKIFPQKENTTYTISGYFNGQIVVMKKNTIIKLNNAFIENTSSRAAIKCEEKTEISAAKDSVNYVVSSGRGFFTNAALQSERDLVIGGSGTLFIRGYKCHGVEAEDVKIKGSGDIYIEGTKAGSAVTCDSFTVEEGKTFNCYLLNSKNGIKADEEMKIASGNFYIFNNDVALKTDDESENRIHSINISGAKVFTFGNKQLYITDDGMFNACESVFEEIK